MVCGCKSMYFSWQNSRNSPKIKSQRMFFLKILGQNNYFAYICRKKSSNYHLFYPPKAIFYQ